MASVVVVYLDQCVWSDIAHERESHQALAQVLAAGAAGRLVVAPVAWPHVFETLQWYQEDGSNQALIGRHINNLVTMSGGFIFRNLLRESDGVDFTSEESFQETWLSRDYRTLVIGDVAADQLANAVHDAGDSDTPSLFTALALVVGSQDVRQEVEPLLRRRRDQLAGIMRQFNDPAHHGPPAGVPARLARVWRAGLSSAGQQAANGRSLLSKSRRGDALDIEHRLYASNCDYACLDRDSADGLVWAGMPRSRVFTTQATGIAQLTTTIRQHIERPPVAR